jgi:hypothetical protein
MYRNDKVGLIGFAVMLAGVWLLSIAATAAISTAYQGVYRPLAYMAGAGLALIASGGLVAGAFLTE